MRCNQYPTTQFLKASKAKRHASDYSDGSNIASGCQSSNTESPNFESDFSDVYSIRSDEESDCLEHEVLVKTYNEQGHYATKQSIEKVLGSTASSLISVKHSLVALQIFAVVLIIIATIMYYSWILIGSDASET